MINNQILNITFSSPNKKALNKACLLFARYFLNQKNSLLKKIKISAKKKTNKYTVTLLKSPHVHKTAQETFASEFYTKKITINCYLLKFCNLYFLKKSIESLFSNVSIKTQIYTYRQNELRLILQLIYPKNKKINKKLIVFYT
jgi:ribosomal protein S10